jgi:hypothetical protein
VFIEDDKFKYLASEKLGKLGRAGVADLSKSELEEAIRSKLRSNYLYNLDWRDVPAAEESAGYQGATFFNILLEFPREGGHPERMTVALEFIPAEVMRVTTIT